MSVESPTVAFDYQVGVLAGLEEGDDGLYGSVGRIVWEDRPCESHFEGEKDQGRFRSGEDLVGLMFGTSVKASRVDCSQCSPWRV